VVDVVCPAAPTFFFCFAPDIKNRDRHQKKVAKKKRRFLANCSAGQKKALRWVRTAIGSFMVLVFLAFLLLLLSGNFYCGFWFGM
jgi:hypothetical protein